MVSNCTSSYVNTSQLQSYYEQSCQNNTSCNISLNSFLYPNSTSLQNSCTNYTARIFVNLNCTRSDENLDDSKRTFKIITTLVVSATLVFYLVLFYFYKHLSNKRNYYYSKQTSVAAFSIRAEIPKSFWQKVIDKFRL